MKNHVNRSTLSLICVLIAVFGWAAVPAAADDDAARTFAQGEELLSQGEFDKALAAFSEASTQDPKAADYSAEAAILRRVLKLRDELTKEQDAEKWLVRAQALRAYYYSKNLYGEALTLDRQAHAKRSDLEGAMRLAESFIETDRNQEAAALLAGVNQKELPTTGLLLLALAQVGAGEPMDAKLRQQIEKDVSSDDPEQILLFARLEARQGRDGQALELLKKVFEQTAESQHGVLSGKLAACSDFSSLKGDKSFSKVLETKSKIAESSCSSGKSCGGCPSRTSCSKGGM